MRKLFFTLLVICTFSLNTSFAQPTPLVTPTNYPQVAQEIYDMFGSIIQVNPLQIASFFTPAMQNINLLIPEPGADILSYNGNDITFTWPDIPVANRYRVSHLNLRTGSFGSQLFTPQGNNEYTLSSIPDDLYLFAFQSQSGSEFSPSFIIIADKDVAIAFDPSGLDCECFTTNDPVLVTNSPAYLPQDKEILVEVIDTDESNTQVPVNIKVKTSTDFSDLPITINPDCLQNSTSFDNKVIYFDYGADGSMSFDAFGSIFLMFFETNQNYDIYMTVCEANSENGSSAPEPPTVTIQDIPGGIQLNSIMELEGNGKVHLFDLTGRLLYGADVYLDGAATFLPIPNINLPEVYVVSLFINGERYTKQVATLR